MKSSRVRALGVAPQDRVTVVRFGALAGCLILWAACAGLSVAGDDFARDRQQMVDELRTVEGIKNPRVLEAMGEVPRHQFVSRKWRRWAYDDMALPIGHAQTLTPPSWVAYMTEQLDVHPEDRVLEVGTGCGYQAAILSRLAREVYTVEIVAPLGRQARSLLRQIEARNVQVRIGDGYRGWPEMAPFDTILVTCSPESIPEPLVTQLAEGGRMIIPVGEPYEQTLYRLTKRDGKLTREALLPTVFVPMTGAAEAERKRKADPLHPTLVNGDFAQVNPETGRLTAWYHQRQLVWEPESALPGGGPCATFQNREPGRAAQTAQALPIDGRRLRTVRVAGWVRSREVIPGEAEHQIATLVVTFFDRERGVVGQRWIGDWRGTTAWRRFDGSLEVPRAARELILQIGLHGATGSVSFARLSLTADPEARTP